MLADQFTDAAAAAHNSAALDNLARLLWRAHAEAQITDADAGAISEALQARRAVLAVRVGPSPLIAASGLRRPSEPRSIDRQASITRRRRQAMSGAIPSKLSASFTMAENAVLTVIGRQCQRGGTCSLPIDAIAALAGVSRTSVKRALREARRQGLILVKERRIPGRKSLTNVVTVISRDWLAWLRLGAGKVGGQKVPTTFTADLRSIRRKEAQEPRHAVVHSVSVAKHRQERSKA